MQIELPLIFSEYSFLEQKDVEEYLELLCDVDGYFENMLEYERLRADKGFTLKDSLLEDVISSCQSVIDSIKQENSTNRLFIDDLIHASMLLTLYLTVTDRTIKNVI